MIDHSWFSLTGAVVGIAVSSLALVSLELGKISRSLDIIAKTLEAERVRDSVERRDA